MTQLPLFKPAYDSDWRPPRMDQLPNWVGAKRIGLDTETNDPKLKKLGIGVRRGGYMIGISFAIEDGPSFYLPFAHQGGDNMDQAKVLQYMRDMAKTYTGDLVGANIGYDLDYMAEQGVVFKNSRIRDVQVAEPLIDENQRSYSLDNISKRHGFPGKNEELLREAATAWQLDPKKDMWRLPARFVGPYAVDDAVLPLKVIRKQEKIIDDMDLWDIYNLECEVLPVLVKMRRRGVRIDFDQLQRVEDYTIKEEKKWLDVIYRHTNIRIGLDEINKKGPIAAAFDDQGIKYGRTPTGQPQMKMEMIAKVADTQPVAQAYCHAKYLNKIRNTFVKSVREHETNGRIHCTFNQLKSAKEGSEEGIGAGPGRLSSSNPNLQQQPGRLKPWWVGDRIDKMWRSVYIPDEGGRWAALDYSGQEPRLFVHYSRLTGCTRAQEAVDYIQAGGDFHDMTTEMAFNVIKANLDPKKFNKLRKSAKAIFLGLVYGMGGAKLCKSLGFPTEWVEIRGEQREVAGPEGRRFIEDFNAKVPFLVEINQKAQGVAWSRRYIRTLLGRHIHYPHGAHTERKALNNLIQGSAADQTKLAMVMMDREGLKIQLQVHDEIDTTIYSMDEATRMAEIMESCVDLLVPSKVDVEVGANWGDSME